MDEKNYERTQPDVNNPKFSPEGQNKVRAIKDARQALDIARRLESEDGQGSFYQGYGYTGSASVTRDTRRARVLAAYNGEPPYPQKSLEERGENWRKNISFGFSEGVIGRAFSAYINFLDSQKYLAQIDTNLSDEKKQIVQEEFSKIVTEWGGWDNHIGLTILEHLLYGWCVNIMPDEFNPWPHFIPQKDSFVHILSKNNVKDLSVFVWRKTFQIHELYEKIQNPEMASMLGWDVDNVRKAIENAMPQNANPMFKGWQSVEEALRDGYSYFSIVGGKVIEAYYVFARELDGQISNYIVLNDKSSTEINGGKLFYSEDRFISFDDMLVYYDLEIGDGHWHGSRGLGQRIYNTHRAIDQTRCDILDKALMGGKPVLQASDEAGQIEMQLAVVGPFTVLPAGVTMQSTGIPALPDTAFQADALLTATAEQRVGDVVPNSISQLGVEKTATQSKIDASRQSIISKNNIQRFITPVSKILTLILKRLLIPNSPNEDAQKFQSALIQKGLNPDDFLKIKGAKISGRIEDVFGEVSQGIIAVFNQFRGDPDIDQQELKRLVIESEVGVKNVPSLLIPKEDNSNEIESIRLQELEISSIIDNDLPVPVSPRDNHLMHLQAGIKWIQGELVKAQQGQTSSSPKQIDSVGKHMIDHLNFLSKDKSNYSQEKHLEMQLKHLLMQVDNHIKNSINAMDGMQSSGINSQLD